MTCQLCNSTRTQDLSSKWVTNGICHPGIINVLCLDCGGHFYRSPDGSLLGWFNAKDWNEYVLNPHCVITKDVDGFIDRELTIKQAIHKAKALIKDAPAPDPEHFERR